MAKEYGSKGGRKITIENTSRDVGQGKTPGVPSTLLGTTKTQEEIGGELGRTENDR